MSLQKVHMKSYLQNKSFYNCSTRSFLRQCRCNRLQINHKFIQPKEQENQIKCQNSPDNSLQQKNSKLPKDLFLFSSAVLLQNRLTTFQSRAQEISQSAAEISQQSQELIEQQQQITEQSAASGVDPVIAIMFTAATVLLSVLTLGFVYLSISSFFEQRQENKDKEEAEKELKKEEEKEGEKEGEKKKLVNPTGKGFGNMK
eukprot:TRINITY_DN4378_c0_g1_i1.p2 TRINITY_DN4378_c0_g1~~TRINITY_DN4378_c0_g1_i1.p2  ORF type:complete len:201 (+),score=31.39 TRINITY_DN4378_c0_g1_i1:103-705(+)